MSNPKRYWVERVLGADWLAEQHVAGATGAADFRRRWNKAVAG